MSKESWESYFVKNTIAITGIFGEYFNWAVWQTL